MSRRWWNVPAVLGLAAAVAGCQTDVPPDKVSRTLERAAVAARDLVADGNMIGAAQLLNAAAEVDPDYPGLMGIMPASERGKFEYVFDNPFLGSNVARREQFRKSIPIRILLYFPDRLIDFIDCVSFDLHIALGLFANVHFTRAIQVGAGVRATGGIGWHDLRSLGGLTRTETEFVLPFVGTQYYAGGLAGTSGFRTCTATQAGFHRPSNKLYQMHRDYWAFGASVTAAVVGVDFDFHSAELMDFIVGWTTIDLLFDDFAKTKGIQLTAGDEELIREMSAIARSRDTMENYRRWRQSPEGSLPPAGAPPEPPPGQQP